VSNRLLISNILWEQRVYWYQCFRFWEQEVFMMKMDVGLGTIKDGSRVMGMN
jgi:hypothetical protein